MVAIVTNPGSGGRGYESPTKDQEFVAASVLDDPRIVEARSTFLVGSIPDRAGITGGVCSAYGLTTWGHLFAGRQLLAMIILSDLVRDIVTDIRRDAVAATFTASDADAYASCITTFLALNLNRCGDLNNSLCTWNSSDQVLRNLFKRQALPMVWDFAEANILADVVGGWSTCIDRTAKCLLTMAANRTGTACQLDAADGANGIRNILVSTDPPYYNNISYATLSDFFYVWLRRTVGDLYPNLFSTVLVPKLQELTASPDRFGGNRQKAKEHFEAGFRSSFTALRGKMDPRFPLTVYYAFKQDDEDAGPPDAQTEGEIDLTTGWETLLEALVTSGFQITATWPVRASQKWRMVSMGTNALASYIVLACRPRPDNAPQIASTQFRQELRQSLPGALRRLQQGNIAPVDFAQAALGPGMSVYSKYNRILESSGRPMSVRSAIGIINQILTEVLSELEDDFDADTRWAIAWFEQNGFEAGDFGDAEVLSKAKVTAVSGLQQAGIVVSRGGKVRLLRADELRSDWDPMTNSRTTIWHLTHHLLRVYHHEQAGDEATAVLLRKMGSEGDLARELAYRLFKVAEKRSFLMKRKATTHWFSAGQRSPGLRVRLRLSRCRCKDN
jgi:putative DNA methylase